MKKTILLTVSTLILATTLMAQMKVAGYSFGKPGTDKYEHLEFWTKDSKPTEVNYAYGKDRKEVKLQYLGKAQIDGKTCLKVRFTNNYILYVVPRGLQLQVTDMSGKYNKKFLWEYEGPINGIGTFCDVCAEDDEDAMKLIQSAFLN